MHPCTDHIYALTIISFTVLITEQNQIMIYSNEKVNAFPCVILPYVLTSLLKIINLG